MGTNNNEDNPENNLGGFSDVGGRPVVADNLVLRLAPLLITLTPEEIEFIKAAYISSAHNGGIIKHQLLAEILQISERTMRNRKNKIAHKVFACFGPAPDGKTFPG